MSDTEAKSPATAATNVDVNEDGNAQEVTTPEPKIISPRLTESLDVEATSVAAPAADDSEAETLIESPEKRKAAAMLSTEPNVKTESIEPAENFVDKNIDQEPGLPSSDGNSRKRKRLPDNLSSEHHKRAPSASSALSSPSPDELHSEPLGQHKRKVPSPNGQSHHDRSDRRDGSADREWRYRNKSVGQIKVKKRRPSDVFTEDQQPRSTKPGRPTDHHDRRETRSATYPRNSSSERSPSPRQSARGHKRVQSIQSVGTSGASGKSRRIPPLLTGRHRHGSEERRSVSTDRSGSPAPTSAFPNLRKLNSYDHEVISPAKQPMGPTFSRKNRDQNGRTRLARACADNKIDVVRAKYEERPEDLNVSDNAGNTPLQIASLEGYVDIVEFLLSKNCEVDSKNIDKETALIDAVENGHVDVVQLLLENGANPRLGNAKGDEPYELVPQDDENYGAIRALLADARTKQKDNERQHSDDHETWKAGARSSSRAASAASPRDSPPIHTPRSPPSYLYSRRRTGRSEQTRNDLLWQAQTPENLQKLAAKGDSEGVASILNVLEKVHPAAVIAAARGGHHQTLEMLIALGQPDPDPPPVRNGDFKPGYNTPMLAAIGRGNIEVIKLLLGQTGFNARRHDGKGRSYPEISKERKGDRWEEEYKLLKEAYDRTRGSDIRKHESPRKAREREKEPKRNEHRSLSPSRSGRKPQRSPSLATKDPDTRKSDLHRENKRERTSDDHRSIRNRDRGNSPAQVKTHRTRRSQSDLPTVLPDGEIKRRRLVSGKVLHERRASMASQKSSSDHENAEAKANIKRELKKERSLLKRSRNSMTPEAHVSPESEASREVQKKRRRVLSDSSPEKTRSDSVKKQAQTSTDRSSPPANHEASSETTRGPQDVAMADETPHLDETPVDSEAARTQDEENQQALKEAEQAKAEAERVKAKEDELKAKEEVKKQEDARVLAEKQAAEAAEAARKKAEEEAIANEIRRKAEELAAEQKRLEEEAAARQREEEEKAERVRKEEEERLERQRREEERQRRIEERRRREAEEQERIRREALPALLCKTAEMLDEGNPLVRDHSWLQQFLPLFTVHTRQLEPGCSKDVAEEEWIPNFQAAGLLVAKDLHLHQYSQLEKRKVNRRERIHLWKVAGVKLSKDFNANAFNTKFQQAISAYDEAGVKFSTMEPLFWVRLSDFRDLIPLHNHLKTLPIKTQRIRVHPIAGPIPDHPGDRLNGFSNPASVQIANTILPNGISHVNGYHHD